MKKGITMNQKFVLLAFALFFILLASYPVNSSELDNLDNAVSLTDEMPNDRGTASEGEEEDSETENGTTTYQPEEISSNEDEGVTLVE